MKLSEAKAYFKKHPCRDLNGKWVAYDIEGKALGEVVYKKGVVISKRTYGKQSNAKRAKRNKTNGNGNK